MTFVCYRNILALLLTVALLLSMYYLFLRPNPASERDTVKSAGAGAGAGGNGGKITDTLGEEIGFGAPVTMKALGMSPHISGLALVGATRACVDASVTASLGAVVVPGALNREVLFPSPSSDLSNSLVLADESNTDSIVDAAPRSLGVARLENNSSASPASTSPVVVSFIC